MKTDASSQESDLFSRPEPHSDLTTKTGLTKPKRTFKQRILHNFKEVAVMFLYLWLLFALFTYHKALVLAQHNIDFRPFGLAFINAFVLAKIMLVAEELQIGTRLRRRAPIFPILHKSLMFAIIFVCFNFAESIVIGWWKGKSIGESIHRIGGGSVGEMVIGALIITVALIPFFAFRELSRVMGKGVLETLFLRGRPASNNSPTPPDAASTP